MSWQSSLIGVVGEGINTAINYGLGSQSAENARNQNYALNEAAAQNAYARQIAMQERYYTPTALLRQYNEAGLSPSLLFGGTPGQGGTSAPQGHGAAGVATPFAPMSLINAAQAADLFASANLKKEQAKELKGENEFGQAEIDKMRQETATALEQAKMYKAEGMYKGLMYDYQMMINEITEATKTDQIREIAAKADTQEAQADYWDRMAELTNLEFEFNSDTYNAKIEGINNTNKKLIADTIKAYSESSLNETKQTALITEAEIRYLEYLQEQEKILISDKEATAKLEQIRIAYKNLQIDILDKMLDKYTSEMQMKVEEKKAWINALTHIFSMGAAVSGYAGVKTVPKKRKQ